MLPWRRYHPGRHHVSVQIGTRLFRSQRRNAKSLASMMEALCAHPPEPAPMARQTHAEASVEAAASKSVPARSESRIRPISPSSMIEERIEAADRVYCVSRQTVVLLDAYQT
jgi:hypothetical protein